MTEAATIDVHQVQKDTEENHSRRILRTSDGLVLIEDDPNAVLRSRLRNSTRRLAASAAYLKSTTDEMKSASHGNLELAEQCEKATSEI